MSSFGTYGLSRLSPAVIFAPFGVGLITLLSIPLKVAGIVADITPIVVVGAGVIGIMLSMLGLYMIREALSIRKKFVVAMAEVIDSAMSVAGRRVTFRICYQGDDIVASLIRQSGHSRKGSKHLVLFNPRAPDEIYLYGVRFFFVPAMPLIIGAVFLAIVVRGFT
jgi:hypothetical protein